jgi:hypothetical protein
MWEKMRSRNNVDCRLSATASTKSDGSENVRSAVVCTQQRAMGMFYLGAEEVPRAPSFGRASHSEKRVSDAAAYAVRKPSGDFSQWCMAYDKASTGIATDVVRGSGITNQQDG